MISASHNPFYDNGIKLMNGAGEKMDDDMQTELEAFLDGEAACLPWVTEGRELNAAQCDLRTCMQHRALLR